MAVRASRSWAALTILIGSLAWVTAPPGLALPAASGPPTTRSTVTPGKWTLLGLTTAAGTPAVWQSPSGPTSILWLQPNGGLDQTYRVVTVSSGGAVSAAADVFAGAHWQSLSNEPTLVADGTHPLVVFDGSRGTTGLYSHGCVYGAAADAQPWTLQTWVLSGDCVNPVGTAANDGHSGLAAAWPGGWATGHGVEYRDGATAYPAAADPHIGVATGVAVAKVGLAADSSSNPQLWVAWTETDNSSAAQDGYYVENVTTPSSPTKMPGTGTMSVAPHLGPFSNLAITNRLSKPGIYLAACSNTTTCTLKLWRVGAGKALTVPGSKNAGDVAISRGPGGRIWVAWYDAATNKVDLTRTNTAATAFGVVRTFKTPCVEHGELGLSAGPSARLVLGLQCVNSGLKTAEYVTTATAGLSLHASATKVAKGTKITFTVTDAGDPVSGAKVSFEGHSATTNSHGKAVLKATSTGTATAKATHAGYAAATVRIKVT